MYKQLYRIYRKEKLGIFWILYYLIPTVISMILDSVFAYVIIFSMILFTSAQITRMYTGLEINCINAGYYQYRKHRGKNVLFSSLLANTLWLIVLEIKILFKAEKPFIFILAIMVLWVYLNIIGNFIGLYIQNEIIHYGVIILFIISCLIKLLLQEQYFRYVSPMLFVFNQKINIFNLLGIVILSVMGSVYLFSCTLKMKRCFIITTLSLFLLLLVSEILYERQITQKELVPVEEDNRIVNYNNVLEEAYARRIGKLITEADSILNAYGFNFKTNVVNIKYSIYFPWEDSSQKVFIVKDGDICYVNCFSDSMCELSDAEIITRYVYSILDPYTTMQEMTLKLLTDNMIAQLLTGETSPNLMKYSWDGLVGVYGSCVSPKQCVIAECMLKDASSLSVLYETFHQVNDFTEMDFENLPVNEEYKAILRRIME